jgi:hypothetical protein
LISRRQAIAKDTLLASNVPHVRQLPFGQTIYEVLSLLERQLVMHTDKFADNPIGDSTHYRTVYGVGINVSADVSDTPFVTHRVQKHKRAGQDCSYRFGNIGTSGCTDDFPALVCKVRYLFAKGRVTSKRLRLQVSNYSLTKLTGIQSGCIVP